MNHGRRRSATCGWAAGLILCVAGSAAAATIEIYSEDFNAGNGGYTTANPQSVSNPWTYNGAAGVGGSGAWRVDGITGGTPNLQHLLTASVTVLHPGPVILRFEHQYDFEATWDGGVVDLAVNGGAFSQVPLGSFTTNGYNQTIQTTDPWNIPESLNGLKAYSGASGGFLESEATLGTFNAGDVVQLRFRGGWDWMTQGGNPNWVIDNVRLLQDAPSIIALSPTNVTTTSACLNGWLTETGALPTAVFVVWGPTDPGTTRAGWAGTNEWAAPQGTGVFSHAVSPLDSNRTYYCRFATTNASGTQWADPAARFITGEIVLDATVDGTEIGPRNAVFSVTRPQSTTNEDLRVTYNVDEGVADSATEGVDYKALPKVVDLPAGTAATQVVVAVRTDYESEPTEAVRLVLAQGPYALGGSSSATAHITNAPSPNTAAVWWRDRDGNTGSVMYPYWTDLYAAITSAARGAMPPTGQVALVKISTGTVARLSSSEHALRLTGGAQSHVTISGGWAWNGGAEPVTRVGRTTLDANSGALDSVNPVVVYNGLKDANHFTIYNATNVILDGLVLINGRPEMDWPSGRTSEAWGSSIRIVKAHNTTLTNLVIASNDVNTYEGAYQVANGGSVFARSDFSENWSQLYGFRMTKCELAYNGENDNYATGVTLMQVGANNAPAIIENCSFHGNRGDNGLVLNATASTDSNGVRNRVLLANCRIWNNRGAQLLHTETSHSGIWHPQGGGGEGGFETAVVTPNQRVTLFGSLVAGNYATVATWTLYTIMNYSEGLSHGEGFSIVNSTIVSNRNTTAGTWGRIYTQRRGSSGDNLRLINSIVQDFDYVQATYSATHGKADIDMQATTFSTNGPSLQRFWAQGTAAATNWTVLADALTGQDPDGAARYFNRNDTDGTRESAAGSNRQGDPGFLGQGNDPYQPASPARNANAAANTVDKGITRIGPGYTYVDVNFDGTYTVGWDIVVAGTPPGGGQDLVYTTDLLGHLRVKSATIDRGAYEPAYSLPTLMLVR